MIKYVTAIDAIHLKGWRRTCGRECVVVSLHYSVQNFRASSFHDDVEHIYTDSVTTVTAEICLVSSEKLKGRDKEKGRTVIVKVTLSAHEKN